jgi:RNA recognition motif-containing protein
MSDSAVEQVHQTYQLFIGNIPFQCTHDKLTNLFSQLDGYVSCNLVTKTTRQNTEISRGFGFVTFNNDLTYNQVLSSTEYEIDGRKLRFAPFDSNHVSNQATTNRFQYKNLLFIKNVNISEEELKTQFERYGPVWVCYINKDQNGISRGTGVIGYKNKYNYTYVLRNRQKVSQSTGFYIQPFRNTQTNDGYQTVRPRYQRKVQN